MRYVHWRKQSQRNSLCRRLRGENHSKLKTPIHPNLTHRKENNKIKLSFFSSALAHKTTREQRNPFALGISNNMLGTTPFIRSKTNS